MRATTSSPAAAASNVIDGAGGSDTVVIDGNLADVLVSYRCRDADLHHRQAGDWRRSRLHRDGEQCGDLPLPGRRPHGGAADPRPRGGQRQRRDAGGNARHHRRARQRRAGRNADGLRRSTARRSRPAARRWWWTTAWFRSALDGLLTFAPALNFFGATAFAYEAVDGLGQFHQCHGERDRQQRERRAHGPRAQRQSGADGGVHRGKLGERRGRGNAVGHRPRQYGGRHQRRVHLHASRQLRRSASRSSATRSGCRTARCSISKPPCTTSR